MMEHRQAETADLLPGAGRIGLAGSFHSRLELMEADESGGKAAPVGNVGKDDAGGLIVALLKGPVSHRLQVGLVRAIDELLQRT